MAKLIKCPICNRDGVADNSTSCPGCGGNIERELRLKASKPIIGTWKDENRTYQFNDDGTFEYYFHNYSSSSYSTFKDDRRSGTYTVVGDKINLNDHRGSSYSSSRSFSIQGNVLDLPGYGKYRKS